MRYPRFFTPPLRTPRLPEWLALIALFLLAGILGHDPWKQDETYSFGIIYHFLTTHTWLVPTNAGTPFLEKPPLYYWSAVLMCRLLGDALPLYDAARLTSVFYMLITLAFLWCASQVLFQSLPNRRALGGVALVLLLGSFGIVRHAHDMFTDVALLAGTTIALYGMALLVCRPERWKSGGAWLGIGIGMAFLSKGLLVPCVFAGAGLLLYARLPALRTRSLARALLVAALAASPFVLLWPALLYRESPELFMTWFWDNNVGRFLGFSMLRLHAERPTNDVPRALLWFALPAFPLAVAQAIRARRAWRAPEYALPAAVACAGLALLLASVSARALYVMPLIPAFALLGAPLLPYIPAAALAAWNRVVMLAFTLMIASTWAVWVDLHFSPAARFFPALLQPFGRWLPLDFTPPDGQTLAIALAAALTATWLAALRLPVRSPMNTAYLWLAGVAAVWGAVHTLLLPWLDDTKSYRGTLAQMEAAIVHSHHPKACLAGYDLGESIAPMLEYFDHREPMAGDFSASPCPLLLVHYNKHKEAITNAPAHWQMLWEGHRPLDEKCEELRLYERK